jgi:hypothetical protein
MNSPQYIPSFYFYKFAQGISEPYTSLNAYKAGAVDGNGNVLKAESSIDPLEYLIIKLKKIFEELPSGLTKAKLGNYMSTMQLFGEEVKSIGITEAEYTGLVEGYIAVNIDPSISYVELLGEDMGAGGMGAAASSPGYNQGSVSGYDPVMGTMRRNKPVLTGFDACEMFDVCPEEMSQFKNAKAWKHVPDSETKRYLQRYQRRNPTGHMAVRSVDPESGKTEIHWVKLKPMSFMEEFKLDSLDILHEEYDDDGFLILETKKQIIPRTHDNDNDQFKAHVMGLMNLHTNTNNNARRSEYEARLINHIKNYHSVKNNPEHLKTYIDTTHPTILNSASASSKDTHMVRFDELGAMTIKSSDVKDISRGDAYVNMEIHKNEFAEIPGVKELLDSSTSGESGELRVRRGEKVSSAIKKSMDDYYQNNPSREMQFHPKESSFMVKRNDGRFYMAGPEILGSTSERDRKSVV